LRLQLRPFFSRAAKLLAQEERTCKKRAAAGEFKAMTKTAVITGITGQDGAYLSALLLEKGYRVVGVVRRSSHGGVADHRMRWLNIADKVTLVDGNLVDLSCLIRIMQDAQPDEVYNLAAQSFVAASWNRPVRADNGHRRAECLRPCVPRPSFIKRRPRNVRPVRNRGRKYAVLPRRLTPPRRFSRIGPR
jgi:hypothetical protein